jgi:hypothetical protein
MRTRAAVTSINGLIAGVGSFAVGFGLWYFLANPFENSGADGWGDLQGSTQQFDFLAEYLGNHALGANRFFPEWYVVVAALLGGAALAYYLKIRDPLAGMGKGAHVGVGYFVLAALIAFGAAFTQLSDALEYDTWPDAIVAQVNTTLQGLSAQLVLAGVFYPVAFAAIGGAVGAKVYETQSGGAPQPGPGGYPAQQGGSPPPTGQGGTPPQQGGSPPPAGGQPPQQGGSPPPTGPGGTPPQQGGSPPPAGGQPPQQDDSPPDRDAPSQQGTTSPPPADDSDQSSPKRESPSSIVESDDDQSSKE